MVLVKFAIALLGGVCAYFGFNGMTQPPWDVNAQFGMIACVLLLIALPNRSATPAVVDVDDDELFPDCDDDEEEEEYDDEYDEDDEDDEDDVRLVSPPTRKKRMASLAIYDVQGRIVAAVETNDDGDVHVFTSLGYTAIVSTEVDNDVTTFPIKDGPMPPEDCCEGGTSSDK